MTKVKYFTLILMVLAVILIIPNMSNAAELTYSDTEQGVEWGYELDSSDNVINLRCKTTGKTGKINIPSTIDGKTVISLNEGYSTAAFKGFTGLTEVTIPNTITAIGNYAFEGCTGLTTVTIPDSVTSIGNMAFSNCTGLTSVTLSKNLTSLGYRVFEKTGLKNITIPDSVTTIGNNIFENCAGLASVTLPKNLTTLGTGSFRNCSGLKTITIPDSVTTIGSDAFEGCSALTQVTLSKNLTKIANGTFEACKALKSVIIPEGVTTIEGEWIEGGAFEDCTSLAKILIPDSVVTIEEYAFDGCNKLTIYGNDGMTSKEYAEENEIPFEYIANWNKENSGSDITAPTVKSIKITSGSVSGYHKDSNTDMYIIPADAKLVINVEFSEEIKGTTVPTLTVKFGEGQNINVTEGTIGGSTVTYTYTIKNTDKGTMTAVSLTGGNITDEAGNAAKLSCPKLEVDIWGGLVYANGTVTNPDNGGNTNGGNTNSGNTNGGTTTGGSSNSGGTTTGGSSNSGGTTTGGSSNSGGTTTGGSSNAGTTTTDKNNDKTTSTGKLPQTGLSITVAISIVVLLAGGSYAYIRYNKLGF